MLKPGHVRPIAGLVLLVHTAASVLRSAAASGISASGSHGYRSDLSES